MARFFNCGRPHYIFLSFAFASIATAGCGSADPSSPSEAIGTSEESLTEAAYIQTPGGVLVHPSCFHVVPNGAMIDAEQNVVVGGTIDKQTGLVIGGKVVDVIRPCVHPAKLQSRSTSVTSPTTNGWVEGAQSSVASPNYLSNISQQMTVPVGSIANGGQELYLFSAFTDSTGGSILQPVLQWGTTSSNGNCGTTNAPTWGLSSWYLGTDGSRVATAPSCGVVAGEAITTEIYVTSPSSCTNGKCSWGIELAGNSPRVVNGEAVGHANFVFTRAFEGVLEAYNITNCNQYPNGSAGVANFSGTTVEQDEVFTHINLTWSTFIDAVSPSCSFGQNLVTGGVNLLF